MNKILKLPVLSSIGGIVFYVLNFIVILLGFGGSWSPTLSKALSYIPLLLNIIIITIIGIILRRTYSRRDAFRSASFLVVYTIILMIVQTTFSYFGVYNFTLDWILSLPISLFRMLLPLSVKYNDLKTMSSIFMFISIFEPYIMILFAKKDKKLN